MSVVVTADCRPYYNYGLHELTKGTVIPDGEFASFLLATGAPVEEQADGPAVDVDGDGVPDGTIVQVLEWVGDDSSKAAAALKAEQAGKNRATLVASLEKLAAPAADQEPAQEPAQEPECGATDPDAPGGADEGGTDADGQG